MPPPGRPEYEQLPMERRDQWRAWLAAHHDRSPGVWLITWKKASGHPVLSYEDIVEEALCFGWVDSRVRGVDEQRTSLLLTPRRARSNWSTSNRRRVERLEAEGLMTPAGRAHVEAAQARGAWPAQDA